MIKMAEPLIQVKKHVPAGTIIINRPDKRNALSREMISQLEQAFRDLHGEKSVRAVILMGAGKAFCAGLCLEELHAILQEDDSLQRWHHDTSALRDLLLTMLRFPKPIIAAVNGPAMGLGAGLVLASDIAVGCEEASFGFPEPKRGVVSGLCAPLLHFRAGGRHAARLLLTAAPAHAQRAVEMGIYDELIESDKLWARSMEIAQEIGATAPEAIQLTKRTLNEMVGEQLEMHLSAGAAASATSRTTAAAKEGLAAFVEKREPDWR